MKSQAVNLRVYLSLLIALLSALTPVRADDDGRFIGRAIDLIDKSRIEGNYAAPPPRTPAQPMAPRPAPLQVQAAQVSAESRGSNVRLVQGVWLAGS